jgi:hypothetical protein
MSPATITVVVPSAEKESVFILQAVRAAIHAYRRSRPTSPEVPIDRVKVDEESEGLSRSMSCYNDLLKVRVEEMGQ